jgi:hypothetical protein
MFFKINGSKNNIIACNGVMIEQEVVVPKMTRLGV